jgi:hypothetical protein
MIILKKITFFLFIFQATFGLSQDTEKLKVYLECNQQWLCDMDYLRNEMQSVDFVRDRFLCDVQIISNVQFGNGGGENNTLRFIGQKSFENKLDTMIYFNDATATDDIKRKKMLKNLQLGLIPYLIKLNKIDDIEVTIKSKEGSKKVENKKDPFNLWQYTISSSGFFDGDRNYRNTNINNSLSANRETSKNSFTFDLSNRINRNKFFIFNTDESIDTISVNNDRQSLFARYTRKLNEHWGMSMQANGRRSVFDNIDFSMTLIPQVEYSLLPYSKFNDSRVVFSYGIGARHFDYGDSTIYLKTNETLVRQSLNAITSFTKTWGTINMGAFWSNYMHDFSKYNLEIGGSISWNIFKGFRFSVGGNYELIRDQLSLPIQGASRDDLLTKRRLIATSYQYFGGIGFSYTFGSIYNSQVNPTFRGLNWGLNF